ncbi:MAG TPA: hypothetical protein P5175_06220 [Anaerohalosphaeraceae bacterium]|nr:hypothetical protein [Anaerohalosphaeraceae bacterium]HRS71430.1 hypothetical protein [Anaerohalosphaeraceae bacterium]
MKDDVLHSVFNWLDHNRYTVASVVIFILTMSIVVSMTGCESATTGLSVAADGTAPKVSRSEFERQALVGEKDFSVKRIELDGQVAAFNEEVNAFNERVQTGLDDLTRQDEFKQQLLDTIGVVAIGATDGTLNPAALVPIGIGLLGGALGLGTSADNRRKDKVITDLKINTLATT